MATKYVSLETGNEVMVESTDPDRVSLYEPDMIPQIIFRMWLHRYVIPKDAYGVWTWAVNPGLEFAK